ncbi:SprT family protein [Aneurinibacillus terranovensis]|uniref:SprT family protein n=1 Tax=Aneurinibacillus terranovensis TaxID=278991 RepID=UPI0004146E30|nr:SprT family protein [Aneurinibacillus terranovensis]
MTDEELQKRVENISETFFHRPFVHKAYFHSRLRTTGGRYVLRTHNIEINNKHYEMFGLEELDGIIKHELCHYHLHLTGRGYRHADADFKNLLRQVGGTRFCQSVKPKIKPTPPRYMLVCQSCNMKYARKRRMDASKYVCGKCKGPLRLYELEDRNEASSG